MENSGCEQCPAHENCKNIYRGSACAATRYSYGVDFDPLTNADRIRAMTDEELAAFLEGEFGNMEIGTALEWLKQSCGKEIDDA